MNVLKFLSWPFAMITDNAEHASSKPKVNTEAPSTSCLEPHKLKVGWAASGSFYMSCFYPTEVPGHTVHHTSGGYTYVGVLRTKLDNEEEVAAPVDIQIGNLEIKLHHEDTKKAGPVAGFQARVKINGKVVYCKSVDLRVAVDEPVKAIIEFFPSVSV